jgi:Protein of unknown function (DUF2865)
MIWLLSAVRLSSQRAVVLGALVLLCCGASAAEAQNFFSNFFGAFGLRPPPPPQIMMPFVNEAPVGEAPRARASFGGGQAWCVRGCDGRYFPVNGPDNQSREASCHSFCPTSETRLVYGGDIDNAVSENGKPYSELPNAFRYRSEIVAGCTCNGKDSAGLAKVTIESDPTLRKGDIVAGENGLMVANPGSGKHAELNFSPVPPQVLARFRHAPVVARE